MKNEFKTDFEGFKRMISDFIKRLKAEPPLKAEQIRGGERAIHLAFLYIEGTDMERYGAEICLALLAREVAKAEIKAALSI
jgi:hypothetical protein